MPGIKGEVSDRGMSYSQHVYNAAQARRHPDGHPFSFTSIMESM